MTTPSTTIEKKTQKQPKRWWKTLMMNEFREWPN